MANKKDVTQEELVKVIRESLGLKPKISLSTPGSTELLEEAYVIAAKVYNLSTEMLSMKNKNAQQQVLQRYVDAVNETAAQLDAADREQANSDHSDYRSLKMDETYNLNGAFLSGLFLDNVSDYDLRSRWIH